MSRFGHNFFPKKSDQRLPREKFSGVVFFRDFGNVGVDDRAPEGRRGFANSHRIANFFNRNRRAFRNFHDRVRDEIDFFS